MFCKKAGSVMIQRYPLAGSPCSGAVGGSDNLAMSIVNSFLPGSQGCGPLEERLRLLQQVRIPEAQPLRFPLPPAVRVDSLEEFSERVIRAGYGATGPSHTRYCSLCGNSCGPGHQCDDSHRRLQCSSTVSRDQFCMGRNIQDWGGACRHATRSAASGHWPRFQKVAATGQAHSDSRRSGPGFCGDQRKSTRVANATLVHPFLVQLVALLLLGCKVKTVICIWESSQHAEGLLSKARQPMTSTLRICCFPCRVSCSFHVQGLGVVPAMRLPPLCYLLLFHHCYCSTTAAC